MKAFMSKFPVVLQMIRYGVVGVLSNLSGYSIYILVTFMGLDPKIAVTIFYPVGATIAYFSHSKYSFTYKGRGIRPAFRYIIAHFVGYSVNFILLLVFSDKLGLPHQVVQAAAIFIVAGVLFLMFRYYVFSPCDKRTV